MAALAIRTDYPVSELRRLARSTSDRAQALRLVAIAAALKGASRQAAAKLGAMDRQTLRDWVIRYNAEGPAGLKDRNATKGHNQCRLDAGQLAELKAWMVAGPDPEVDGVSAWRVLDAVGFCERRFGLRYSDEGMRRILHEELNLSYQKARPSHTRSDPARAAAFKKGAALDPRRRASRSSRGGSSIVVHG